MEKILVLKKKINAYLPAVIVLLALIYVYQNVISGLIASWGNSEDNSHGFLVLPIFIYMLWQKRDQLAALPIKGSSLGGIFFFLSVCAYIVATAGGILTLASLSLLASFIGGLWFLFGFDLIRKITFPLLFLFFMIPVPEQLYAAVTGPLQLVVTQFASFFLKASGVPVFCQGNVIELPEKVFQVVQACSGLRSIMTMLVMGAIIGYFTLGKIWLRTLFILIGIPVAIVVNILRIYILVAGYSWFRVDLTPDILHTLLGMSVFLVAIGLFFICHKGLARWDK